MKSLLIAEVPEELRDTLREIVCQACNGVSAADRCEVRAQGEYCDVVDPTVDSIHEAYWNYQMKELKS